MKLRLRGMLLFCLLLNLSQQAAAQVESFTFGIGSKSCANWKLNATNYVEGKAWILGYWSGLNVGADVDDKERHMAGSKTDATAIWAEVSSICEKSPSLSLMQAVNAHYSRLLNR